MVGSDIVRGFVVARLAAGLAIHQPVITHANVYDRLTEATILFALTFGFKLLTLRATKFSADSGGHTDNLAPEPSWAKMTEVIGKGLGARDWGLVVSGRWPLVGAWCSVIIGACSHSHRTSSVIGYLIYSRQTTHH